MSYCLSSFCHLVASILVWCWSGLCLHVTHHGIFSLIHEKNCNEISYKLECMYVLLNTLCNQPKNHQSGNMLGLESCTSEYSRAVTGSYVCTLCDRLHSSFNHHPVILLQYSFMKYSITLFSLSHT